MIRLSANATLLLPLLALLLFSTTSRPADAAGWQAAQGDVLAIDIPTTSRHFQLRAFGRAWPWKRVDDGHIRAWVGIDLKTKPGLHDIVVRDDAGKQRQQVMINKGNFRISRITVSKKMAEFDAATLKRIRSDQAAIRNAYGMPVDAHPDIHIDREPIQGVVSTPFGAQRFVNGEPRSPHSGIDIAAPEGTPIISPLAGRVLLARSMYLNGNTVVIGSGNGLVMVYSHMRKLQLKDGDWVKSGQRIGEVGMTGRATGPHLHWGAVFSQAHIDPHALMSPVEVVDAAPLKR